MSLPLLRPPTIRPVGNANPPDSPSSTGSLYLPPLEDPNRPDSMLQPAPSFLSNVHNRDSYQSSLDGAGDGQRQSWGSNALVSVVFRLLLSFDHTRDP